MIIVKLGCTGALTFEEKILLGAFLQVLTENLGNKRPEEPYSACGSYTVLGTRLLLLY